MNPAARIYRRVLRGIGTSAVLAKYASDETLTLKAENDALVIGMLKHAAIPWGAAGKGLAYAAGAAVPATLAGGYLIGKAGDESRKTIEDVRNKALQAAAGVAALGGGLYALHRATKPDTKTTTLYGAGPGGERIPMRESVQKISSVKEEPSELLEKLATVGYLDVLFEDSMTRGDAATREKAAECRLLNAEHGVDILRQLLD